MGDGALMHGVRPGGGDVHDAGGGIQVEFSRRGGGHWHCLSGNCAVHAVRERMKRCLRIREAGWMLCCASSSVVACLAIFPLFTTRTTVILIADGIIFANGYLANGIIDGLAYRSCSDDTWLSTSQFLLTQSISQMALSRPFGPILARSLVEMGGREYYADGQFLMSISGLVCCLKVVYLMIQRSEPKFPV